MLTNLQMNGKPLLQIFLVGQEELRKKLQSPNLEQLRQRVTAAAHLYALEKDQVAAYIVHRLKVAGWKNSPKFMASLLPVIEAACEGVPRRINQFCSRLLLHGAVEQKSVLNANDAKLVFTELSEERLSRMPMKIADNGIESNSPEAGQARL
jgi:type II secretory pathway predicted ATPase ExeA